MKKIRIQLSELILKKKFLFFFLLIAIFLLLHIPIENLLSVTVVHYLLQFIHSAWDNDLLFCSLLFIYAVFVFKNRKNYYPSAQLAIFSLIASLIYLRYRIHGKPWTFTSFNFNPFFKYTDLIFALAAGNVLLWSKSFNPQQKNKASVFLEDESLGTHKADEFGYAPYAKNLANNIQDSHFSKAFAIGINGKWGSGKTSFIDLVKRELQKNHNDSIHIDFNPWNSNSAKGLIYDFFDSIQEKIRPYHGNLARLLRTYAQKLVDLNSNTITQSIHASVFALTGFESIDTLFNEINTTLQKIDKKIIVYIDDVDRLDKNEIIEVIRLIRNTANFYNAVFIVAYDRNYIVTALEKHTAYNKEQFLEKIFQVEITLPYFNNDILRQKLCDQLCQHFSVHHHQIFKEAIIGSKEGTPRYINEWLHTMRDVTRLTNALILNLHNLIEEIDFRDFLRLEILRINFPAVYELLFKDSQKFLHATQSSGQIQQFTIRQFIKDEQKEERERWNAKTPFELDLKKNHKSLSVPEHAISDITSLVSDIFTIKYSYTWQPRTALSVVYPSKFGRYFAYNLLKGNLSEVAFSKARSTGLVQFKLKITEWLNEELNADLAEKFEQISSFDNQEDFEKIIQAIFHFANHPIENRHPWYGYILGFDGKNLMNKLDNHENRVANAYYGGENEKLYDFVRSLFTSARPPFLFESRFLRDVNSEFTHSFALPKNETLQIPINYLKIYTQNINDFDDHVFPLYHCCKYKNFESSGISTYTSTEIIPEAAKQIMRNFVLQKSFDSFLARMIEVEPITRKRFAVSRLVPEIFDNWPNFKKILHDQEDKDHKNLKEFLQFFDESQNQNFANFIEFHFETFVPYYLNH